MKNVIALVASIFVATAAFAVVPAATELPVVVKNEATFQPGNEKEVVFTVAKSDDPTPFGAAARELAGCELRVTVKFNAQTERLTATRTTAYCNKVTKSGQQISGGQITGQLVGADHKTGFRLECKGNPQCLVGALKSGAIGSFLVTDAFGK